MDSRSACNTCSQVYSDSASNRTIRLLNLDTIHEGHGSGEDVAVQVELLTPAKDILSAAQYDIDGQLNRGRSPFRREDLRNQVTTGEMESVEIVSDEKKQRRYIPRILLRRHHTVE